MYSSLECCSSMYINLSCFDAENLLYLAMCEMLEYQLIHDKCDTEETGIFLVDPSHHVWL